MLIAIGSVKGAPYVTSLAVALAARWPTPGGVVVEADPAGGDLAFRFATRREPGLSDLAADTRAGVHGRDLPSYTQRLPGLGVHVLFAPADQQPGDRADAPPGGDTGQAVQVIRLVARNCLGLLRSAAARRLVVVDVGRLAWDSPALALAAAADVWLLACRPGVEAIDAVQVRRDRLQALPAMRASLRLVLAGSPPCPPSEIVRAVGVPVAGIIPDDRRGAAVLAGRSRPGWGWTRLPLLRAAHAIALSLNAEFPTRPEPGRPPAAPAVIRRPHVSDLLEVPR